MPSGKQILIERLFKHSLHEIDDTEENEVSRQVRACLLLTGSHTPSNLECVEHIAYRKYGELEDGPHTQQGTVIKRFDSLLSEFIYDLANLKDVPREIQEKYPGITQDEYWSALHVVQLILGGLEWNSTDAKAEEDKDEDTQEGRENAIASSLRAMDRFLAGEER